MPEPPKKSGGWYAWIIGFMVAFGWGLSSYINQPAKQPANAEVQAQDNATCAQNITTRLLKRI